MTIMRIGFDAKRAFYNNSGLGNYSRDTILSLYKYYPQHEYFLYTPNKRNPISFLPRDKNLHVVKPTGLNKLSQSYWRSISLGKLLHIDNLDIYHGLSNELPANIIQAEIKKVVSIHDLIFLRYPELYNSVDRDIYQQKFFEASLAADKIIAMSHQTKQDLISFFHTRAEDIEVIHQGCNPIFYEKIPQQEKEETIKKYKLPEHFILSVGTLEKRKNALKILEGMIANKIDYPLVFVGKPTPYYKDLYHYVRHHGMENRVYFLHDIPTGDLPAIYQTASVFIYPSIFEGFGIPILEAMNSGTPVITNKYGCFGEAGGDAAIYINPNYPEEIGKAVNQVLNDEQKSREMTEKGYKHVEKFRQDIITAKLMELYKSLLQ
ncbi:MAG: glycosyltransferase family 1 protein [Candidatus Delongbacteria bacterium]|nr:glycosyltransferase family 1 protein [Candidatus Delongbacteria bacterium]